MMHYCEGSDSAPDRIDAIRDVLADDLDLAEDRRAEPARRHRRAGFGSQRRARPHVSFRRVKGHSTPRMRTARQEHGVIRSDSTAHHDSRSASGFDLPVDRSPLRSEVIPLPSRGPPLPSGMEIHPPQRDLRGPIRQRLHHLRLAAAPDDSRVRAGHGENVSEQQAMQVHAHTRCRRRATRPRARP